VMALLNPPTPKSDKLPLGVAFLLTRYAENKQMKLWLQHKHKGRDTFHHIRTSSVQADSAKITRPVDDVRYIVGRVRQAEGLMNGVASLPGRMLGSLGAEQRGKVCEALRGLAAKSEEVAALLEAAVAEVDEEG
jgi:hypothetical protein